MSLNPPTEKAIDKTLRQIIDQEEIMGITETKIQEIRAQSNKDLRNAIQTLQFFSAGKKFE
jgi:DNA polymerase III delta prime subunit